MMSAYERLYFLSYFSGVIKRCRRRFGANWSGPPEAIAFDEQMVLRAKSHLANIEPSVEYVQLFLPSIPLDERCVAHAERLIRKLEWLDQQVREARARATLEPHNRLKQLDFRDAERRFEKKKRVLSSADALCVYEARRRIASLEQAQRKGI